MNQSLTYEFDQVMAQATSAGTFVSKATFQTRTNTTSAAGQVDLTDWNNVAGLVNIPCMLSVESVFRPNQAAVVRNPNDWKTLGLLHLLLNGYYPGALQQYTVLVDGNRYEIMAVEFDSQKQQTRLGVRYYTQ